ncbi:MAG: hypothetical protein AAFP76_09590 [Bacteroidota bacterium]
MAIAGTSFAQTYITDNSESAEASFRRLAENTLQLAERTSNTRNVSASNNETVFIEQVGDGNRVIANTTANSLTLNVLQRGDDNNAFLNSNADVIDQTVVQLGDDNSFVDFSYSSNVHGLDLIQTGNNQNLILYGENSISEKLKINMKGESQSLIIRNFN